jgi:hypothetical protein
MCLTRLNKKRIGGLLPTLTATLPTEPVEKKAKVDDTCSRYVAHVEANPSKEVRDELRAFIQIAKVFRNFLALNVLDVSIFSITVNTDHLSRMTQNIETLRDGFGLRTSWNICELGWDLWVDTDRFVWRAYMRCSVPR